MVKELSEEMKRDLLQVATHFDREDRYSRERQIRLWKKLEYMWDGFQRLWWSEIAHDWRTFDSTANSEIAQTNDAGYYDKPINVYRAYLESIIAALSVSIPPIRCIPDDADNPDDIATAKAGNAIAELIYKHIDAPMVFTHALWIYCTQGMIAAHTYTVDDESLGTYEMPEYEDVEEETDIEKCPKCGAVFNEDPASELKETQEEDEYFPEEHDAELHSEMEKGELCPTCLELVIPQSEKGKLTVTRMVGVTHKPKSRQVIDVWGGLYVKIPNYAKKQADIPYLSLNYETHYTNVIERYPKLADKIGNTGGGQVKGSTYDPYERWGRLNTQYLGEYPINTPTIREWWLRPSAFNVLDEESAKGLKERFPDGCKVVFVNMEFAEAKNANLDDEWTLTHNPLSQYLHFNPLGTLLTSVQEITNDIISLTLQTIEHGIPQTFADPQVLNFAQYAQTEATPGGIFPAKPKAGQRIGDAFYEVKTATLSGEVLPFGNKMQELGQFVSGALPSLWGGAQDSSSRTAAQYSMSRSQSMQRLQTPWKMLVAWWRQIFGKVIPAYIKCIEDDEKFVREMDKNNFINVCIRKAELQGKIGSVELEAADQLPTSWAQKKDVIMNLVQFAAQIPQVMEVLFSPDNAQFVAEAIGLNDFHITGENDRAKQLSEIQELLKSAPVPSVDPMTGMPIEEPSVVVDPLVDNHAIEAEICRGWAVSEQGRMAKLENPNGYKNVLLHLQGHINALQQLAMQQAQTQPNESGEKDGNEPGPIGETARQQAESTV